MGSFFFSVEIKLVNYAYIFNLFPFFLIMFLSYLNSELGWKMLFPFDSNNVKTFKMLYLIPLFYYFAMFLNNNVGLTCFQLRVLYMQTALSLSQKTLVTYKKIPEHGQKDIRLCFLWN